MLDTIQEYAGERLAESNESEALERSHAEYFLGLAEAAHLSPDTLEAGTRHDLVLPEQENLRAVLEWAARNDPVLGLSLAIALEQLWVAMGPHEGAQRVEALLELAPDAPVDLRPRALRVVGGLRYIVGDFERGVELYRESLAGFRALGDELAVGHMLHRLAFNELRLGNLDEARRLTEESLEIGRRHGSVTSEAFGLSALGSLEWEEGNQEAALELMRKSAAFAGEIGFVWWRVGGLYTLCEWSFTLGRLDDCEWYGRQGLEGAVSIGDRLHTVVLLALLARTAVERSSFERAGVLWGAVESEEKRGVIGQWEEGREEYAAPVLAHGGPEFSRGREQGRGLALVEAVAFALLD
jgi:tetratricopeptide (TPR) repeat protein